MKDNDIGSVPVFRGEECVGMLTNRDIGIRAIADGSDPATTPVREAMTAQCISCYEDEELEEAVRLMQSRHIRRILVKDDSDQITGIISLQNIAQAAGDPDMCHDVLQGTTLTEPALV